MVEETTDVEKEKETHKDSTQVEEKPQSNKGRDASGKNKKKKKHLVKETIENQEGQG